MTPEQVKQKFRAEGRTFTDFAKDNGFRLNDVYRVLNGQLKGHYGTSHEIAVKLGLKKPANELKHRRQTSSINNVASTPVGV